MQIAQWLAAASSRPSQSDVMVLANHARLELALCLLMLVFIVGTLLMIRVRRNFMRHTRTQEKPTHYPDAWKESARRLEIPPDEADLGE